MPFTKGNNTMKNKGDVIDFMRELSGGNDEYKLYSLHKYKFDLTKRYKIKYVNLYNENLTKVPDIERIKNQ